MRGFYFIYFFILEGRFLSTTQRERILNFVAGDGKSFMVTDPCTSLPIKTKLGAFLRNEE